MLESGDGDHHARFSIAEFTILNNFSYLLVIRLIKKAQNKETLD